MLWCLNLANNFVTRSRKFLPQSTWKGHYINYCSDHSQLNCLVPDYVWGTCTLDSTDEVTLVVVWWWEGTGKHLPRRISFTWHLQNARTISYPDLRRYGRERQPNRKSSMQTCLEWQQNITVMDFSVGRHALIFTRKKIAIAGVHV